MLLWVLIPLCSFLSFLNLQRSEVLILNIILVLLLQWKAWKYDFKITWCLSSVKMQGRGGLIWRIYTKEVTTKASQRYEHLSSPVPAVPAPRHTASFLCCRSQSCTAHRNLVQGVLRAPVWIVSINQSLYLKEETLPTSLQCHSQPRGRTAEEPVLGSPTLQQHSGFHGT